VLRRLSVFVGSFTFDAAEKITAGIDLDRSRAVDALSSLVAKSLVSLQAANGDTRYRLLDTTRLYALGKLGDSGETSILSRRHAEYYRDLLSSTGEIDHSSEIDNIRAALVWAFDTEGDTALGTRIAAASAPIWLGLSLLTECRAWMERAAACLEANGKASRDELVVQAALGSALMFTVGLSCKAYEGARLHLQQAIELDDEASRQAQVKRFGYDRHSDSLAVLGNLLWQQGQPEQGSELLVRAVAEARLFTHSIPLCVALPGRGFTLTFAGNQSEAAEECVAELHELTARHQIKLSWCRPVSRRAAAGRTRLG
jgi:tetratricopeptide (TPR) repeat protein